MSQENVNNLRRLQQAFSRGDFEGAIQGFAVDVEVRPGVESVGWGTLYHGHDGLRQFWKQIGET